MRLTVLTLALLAVGCFKPSYHNGALRCGDDTPQCPDGYHCAAADHTCWVNGQDPSGGPGDDGGGTGTDVNGTACSAGNTCVSGHCADGVCCDTACTGQCEACDVTSAPGTCTAVSGPPHGTRTACTGPGATCGGTCDGSNAASCSYPPSATICGAACDGHCDGAGSCSSVAGGTCPNGFACGTGACKTSCSAPADCQTNFTCTGNACVRIVESDCLDGLDNNGDGLIDCADPTCNMQVTCVPEVATAVGTVAASCPGGVTGTHINQGFNSPTTCHACGCTVSGTCAFNMYGDQSGTGCFSGSETYWGTFSAANTCFTVGGGQQFFSVRAVAAPNATCGAIQNGVPDGVSYSTSSSFCPSVKSPSTAACPTNQLCVPKPASGNVCTLVAGTSCPGSYPTNGGTWYADGASADTRSCTCTGCSVTSNGSCDLAALQWIVHDVSEATGQCVDNPALAYCSGSCCSWTTQSGGGAMDQYWHHLSAVDSLKAHTIPANTGSTCNGGTGAVTSGSATAGATMTVCCP